MIEVYKEEHIIILKVYVPKKRFKKPVEKNDRTARVSRKIYNYSLRFQYPSQ